MPIASFYALPQKLLTPQEQMRAICRVIAKVWQVMGEVDILCPDAATAQDMDNMLWTFQTDAFVPHGLGTDTSVRICYQPPWPVSCQATVLCGLQDLPSPLPESERLVDFIPLDVAARKKARDRYKQLKNIGYTLQVHALEA